MSFIFISHYSLHSLVFTCSWVGKSLPFYKYRKTGKYHAIRITNIFHQISTYINSIQLVFILWLRDTASSFVVPRTKFSDRICGGIVIFMRALSISQEHLPTCMQRRRAHARALVVRVMVSAASFPERFDNTTATVDLPKEYDHELVAAYYKANKLQVSICF